MQPTPKLSLAFSKSPLESPSCCPRCLTRTWLLSENGNSCGEGRQEELCTNNHTWLPQSHTELGAVNLAGSERQALMVVGEGAYFSSPWELLLNHFLGLLWYLNSTETKVLESHPLVGTQRS